MKTKLCQLFRHFLNGRVVLGLQLLGICQLIADCRFLKIEVMLLLFNGRILFPKSIIAFRRFLLPFFLGIDVHSRGILLDELRLKLHTDGFLLGPHPVSLFLAGRNALLQLLHGSLQLLCALLQLRDFTAASQQIGAAAEHASADRSARHEHFALKGYHTDLLLIFPGNFNRMIVLIYHKNPAKKRTGHIPVLRRRMHQRICEPYDAALLERSHHIEALTVPDGSKRKEGRTSRLFSLQKADHTLGRSFIVRHNVLDAAAECCLNGCLVLRLCLDKIRNNTDKTGLAILLLHDTLDAAAKALIALRQVRKSIQLRLLLMIFHLGGAKPFIRRRQLALFLCNLLFQNLLAISKICRFTGNLLKDGAKTLQLTVMLRFIAGRADQSGG